MSPILVCMSAALVSLCGLVAVDFRTRALLYQDELMWLGVVVLIGWGGVSLVFAGASNMSL